MMTYYFWMATALGFAVGTLHACHIFSLQSALPGSDAKASAFHRALWAIVLWTLFGSYLVTLWIVGLVLSILFGRRPDQEQGT